MECSYKVTKEQAREFKQSIVWHNSIEPWLVGRMEDIKNRLLTTNWEELESLQAEYKAYNAILIKIKNL